MIQAPLVENTLAVDREPVYKRYAVGHDFLSYEFGLQHEDKNVKIEIKDSCPIKIIIDGTEYNSKKD